MPNFTLSNKPLPVYSGGPDAVCSICRFTNHGYPWYLIFDSVFSELNYEVSTGEQRFEGNIHLCSDHATELQGVLNEAFPDTKLPAHQAQVLKAEAARARAEARADKAEAALHAMQDWMADGASK